MLLHSGIVLMLVVMAKQASADYCDALGMEIGKIKDSQITVSSVLASAYGRLARLNKNIPDWGAWCFDPRFLKPTVTQMEYDEYIKINLLHVTKVTKVATQGREYSSGKEYTKKYKISYSDDNSKWIYYKDRDSPANTAKIFDGNTDVSTVVSHILDPVILARYIRIHPGYHVNVVCLRLELYGCKVTPELQCSNLLPILIGLVSLFCLIALIILPLLIKWKLFSSKQPTPNVSLEMESTLPNPDNNVPTTATSSATQASSRDAVVLDVPPDESDYVIPDPAIQASLRDAVVLDVPPGESDYVISPDPPYTELSERTDDGHFYQKLIKPEDI